MKLLTIIFGILFFHQVTAWDFFEEVGKIGQVFAESVDEAKDLIFKRVSGAVAKSGVRAATDAALDALKSPEQKKAEEEAKRKAAGDWNPFNAIGEAAYNTGKFLVDKFGPPTTTTTTPAPSSGGSFWGNLAKAAVGVASDVAKKF